MRHRMFFAGQKYGQGFSLIELMISLVMGLMISLAAFSAYFGASAAGRMSEAQGRMNEDAQAALTILSQQIRMAANNPIQSERLDTTPSTTPPSPSAVPMPVLLAIRNPVYLPTSTNSSYTATKAPSAYGLRGCNGTLNAINTAAELDQLSCSGSANVPHSIGISYEADNYNTSPTTTGVGGLPTDCNGSPLTPLSATYIIPGAPDSWGNPDPDTATSLTTKYFVADNRYYIGTSANIVSPSLYCKGNGVGSVSQPLVENVEDLKFTYGLVNTSTASASIPTAQLAGYLTAEEVMALPATTESPDDAARWAKVITVRICIVVRSDTAVVPDPAAGRYVQCDGTTSPDQPDLRMRRSYNTTVVLRNRRN